MTKPATADQGGRWTLTADAFTRLLSALHPDREQAGELYERLRAKLVRLFRTRGFAAPSELVDATLDRVARKLLEHQEEKIRDINAYACRVAQFIAKEEARAPERRGVSWEDEFPEPAPPEPEEQSELDEALAACLKALSVDERVLILEYYRGDKRAKKQARVSLAARLGITMNALSLRAFYIRRQLAACVDGRLNASAAV